MMAQVRDEETPEVFSYQMSLLWKVFVHTSSD